MGSEKKTVAHGHDGSLVQWPCAKYWDKPWNPIVGCRPVSPACDHCYARASTDRFGCSFEPHESSKGRPPTRGVVFCGNMTDLFGAWMDGLDFSWSRELVELTLGNFGKATYLWLTKRPARMCEALRAGVLRHSDDEGEQQSPFADCEFGNQHFGFTAENQEWYDRRLAEWIDGRPAWVNGWLSAEPLLGDVDLRLGMFAKESLPFKWIVVGCESGVGRRPCRLEWVENIVDQALERGIPVFVKQLDIDGKCERDITKFPEHLRIRQVPWKN